MKRHPFELYHRKHGHYPRLRFDNGVQTVTVEFAPGYVRVQTSSPYGGEIYLTANTVRAMIRSKDKFLGLIRKQDRNFDVPQRVHQAFLEETALKEELRSQKRQRRGDQDSVDRNRAQRERHLRAQARAAKKRQQPET